MALLYKESGQISKAVEEYDAAISLLYDNPERQAIFEREINKIQDNTIDVPNN